MHLRWLIIIPLQVLCYRSNLTFITTGGTIAGVKSPGSTGHTTGLLSANDLLGPLRGWIDDVNLKTTEVASVGSHELSWNDLWKIHSAALTAVGDPFQQGVLFAMGTDLAAAVAFFLDMTTSTDKPIVGVGAIRSPNELSADGWRNLVNAIDVAKSKRSCGRGVLWTSNGEIHSAFYVQKSHTDDLGAFRSSGPGPLGFLKGSEPLFYYPPSRPLGAFNLDPTRLYQATMPRVAIITAHRDMLPGHIRAAVLEFGAKGLVIAGLGAGSFPPDMVEEVRSLEQDYGTVVVTARQTFQGYILAADVGIPGGFLDMHKCQVALQLLLGLDYNHDQIRAFFKAQGREEGGHASLLQGLISPGTCPISLDFYT